MTDSYDRVHALLIVYSFTHMICIGLLKWKYVCSSNQFNLFLLSFWICKTYLATGGEGGVSKQQSFNLILITFGNSPMFLHLFKVRNLRHLLSFVIFWMQVYFLSFCQYSIVDRSMIQVKFIFHLFRLGTVKSLTNSTLGF